VVRIAVGRREEKHRTKVCLFGEGVQAAAEAYLTDLGVLHKFIGVTPEIARYGHPALMATSVGLLAGFGAKLGFEAREEGLSSNKRSLHATLMATLVLVAVAGYGGGSLSNVMLERSLWSSAHAVTGAAFIALLLVNATLAAFKARSVHATVGKSILVFLGVHLAAGLQLLFQQ